MSTTKSKPIKVEKLIPKQPHGLVVVITGNGKGKTTSAMWLVLRAGGHGLKSCVIQFMKDDLYSGELDGWEEIGPGFQANKLVKSGRPGKWNVD